MATEIAPIVGLDTLVEAGSRIEQLTTGSIWAEGPVWLAERNALRWSDIPANLIREYSFTDGTTSVYQSDVEFTNGRTVDFDGSVIQCSHGRRRVERDVDGTVTPIVDSFNGVRLNSPNDVVVASDGSIWFTDPTYGITIAREGHPGVQEYGDRYVFRHDPATGETRPVVIDLDEPNGLAFSPDGLILYVADSAAVSRPNTGNHHIRAYDVDGTLCKNGRVFATMAVGAPDGLRIDVDGNVWTSAGDGVHVYAPNGTELGMIPVPEVVANLCFGGPDDSELFIAATTSIYRIATRTRGHRPVRAA